MSLRQRLSHSLGLQSNSLARRFLLASLVVLLAAGVVIGWWVGDQLERGIIDRTASITGLYVQSFIAPQLESLAANEWLSDDEKAELDELLTDTTRSANASSSLKVWRPDGVIMYSPDRELIGEQFPVEGELAAALSGDGQRGDEQPARSRKTSASRTASTSCWRCTCRSASAAASASSPSPSSTSMPTEIEQQVSGARTVRRGSVVAVAVALAYLLLFGIVRQGSDTIDRQQTGAGEPGDRAVNPARPERAAARAGREPQPNEPRHSASATCAESAATCTTGPARCWLWR